MAQVEFTSGMIGRILITPSGILSLQCNFFIGGILTNWQEFLVNSTLNPTSLNIYFRQNMPG